MYHRRDEAFSVAVSSILNEWQDLRFWTTRLTSSSSNVVLVSLRSCATSAYLFLSLPLFHKVLASEKDDHPAPFFSVDLPPAKRAFIWVIPRWVPHSRSNKIPVLPAWDAFIFLSHFALLLFVKQPTSHKLWSKAFSVTTKSITGHNFSYCSRRPFNIAIAISLPSISP